MPAGPIVARTIPESPVAGKRLGRHVRHDPRSLDYLLGADGTAMTVRWTRHIPALNQGDTSSCTGNAMVGALATDTVYASLAAKLAAGLRLDEPEALAIYSAAETLDGDGPYPPNDNGSSGLSVAKAARNAGLIAGYQHITSLAAAQTAIQRGAFLVGSNWYTSMDHPDASGRVIVAGTVRGGHEYECIGYDQALDLWEFVNSWGSGYGLAGHFFYSSAELARLLSEQGDATVLVANAVPVPITPAPAPRPTPSPAPPVSFVPPWPYAGTQDYFGPSWGPTQCHSGDPRYDDVLCRANIARLQLRLVAAGYAGSVGHEWADGLYEEPTLLAVQRMQRARNRQVTGMVRAGDWAALFSASLPPRRLPWWRRVLRQLGLL